MKKLLFAVVGIALLSFPLTSFAGVSGSPHDMSAYTGGGSPTQELCFGCHVPHLAQGDKLWAQDTTGAVAGMLPYERLCYTCHDGSIATLYDIFDKADGLTDHTMVGSDCSGVGACHDVHNQPAVGGDFLAEGIGANGSKCENCHDATVFAGAPADDHAITGMNHDMGAAAGGLNCEDCHGAHTGVTQGDGTNDDNILRGDNEPVGGAWGAICVECHNNAGPTYTGFIAEQWDYAELIVDGTEDKHPTFGGGFTMTGCNECHDPHQTIDNGYLLTGAHHDAATDLCITCHTTAGNNAPGTGTGTHYTGDISAFGGTPGVLPWAAIIDDDGNTGSDWASATADLMVCETCHSVHKKGNAGYFLRIANTNQNELCTQCHDAN